ncbi:MAG: hypothetical protein HZA61_16595 [Candidatus Eisenbacteria bacterium]|uniref:Uncharacterized protein n=1 Tax=Eiseniibacteriota bacterium TaxID=2212470 RepID=A0A933SEI6_UNCEI|nr:hypothetical protein [Candidatus Eisenbacteria bacterium]
MNDHVQRCRRMIEEQVEQLGTLRNANPRDPGFKLWRQNTLTVLQRVWPGDSTRSERFRRIAFTPTHARPDGQTQRDWYTRGCTEATAYLNALLEMIAREGVPPAPSVKPEALPSAAGAREDDFPVLELPSSGAHRGGETIVLGQGDSLADASAIPGTDSRDEGSPAPPQLKVKLKGPVSTPQAPQPSIPQRPASLPTQAQKNSNAPDGDGPRGPAKLPAQLAGKLPPPPAPEAIEGVQGEVPVLKVEPAAKVEPAGKPAPPAKAEPVAKAAPPVAASEAKPAPAAKAAPAPAKKPVRASKPRKAAPKGKLKDLLGLQALEETARAAAREAQAPQAPHAPQAAKAPPAPPFEPYAPPTPPVSKADVRAAAAAAEAQAEAAEHALPQLDDAAAARATEDFLRSSPVLGLTGKPVQRNTDDTGFSDPDAIAIATLAADAARLGVSEDEREQVRIELGGLAVEFEAHAPQWATLQRAVTLSMKHPELAKRLMPVVLPWLNRAA